LTLDHQRRGGEIAPATTDVSGAGATGRLQEEEGGAYLGKKRRREGNKNHTQIGGGGEGRKISNCLHPLNCIRKRGGRE